MDSADGLFEPYSEEAYERLQDERGRVWALRVGSLRPYPPPESSRFEPGKDYYQCVIHIKHAWCIWRLEDTCKKLPNYIARINPPKEAPDVD